MLLRHLPKDIIMIVCKILHKERLSNVIVQYDNVVTWSDNLGCLITYPKNTLVTYRTWKWVEHLKKFKWCIPKVNCESKKILRIFDWNYIDVFLPANY